MAKDNEPLPARLFVVADEADQASHMGHTKLSELVMWTGGYREVGEYQLVRTLEAKCVERVSVRSPAKKKSKRRAK